MAETPTQYVVALTGSSHHLGTQLQLSTLNFGYAASEEEARREPNLLLDGFFDPQGYMDQLLGDNKYLILGSKGTGKSALVQHLKLKSDALPGTHVVDTVNLAELPWSNVSNINTGDRADSTRTPSAWQWVILLRIYQLLGDLTAAFAATSDLAKLVEVLRSEGFLSLTVADVVQRVSTQTYKIKLPLFEGSHESSGKRVHLNILANEMLAALGGLRRPADGGAELVVALDGLDGLLLSRDKQWESIAGLVAAVHALNSALASKSVPVKVWLLCRLALFDRLPYAESNKIKQDSGIVLNWAHGSKNPQDSWLFDLADRKASVAAGRHVRVVEECFAPIVPYARAEERDIFDYLLSFTRQTPRDLLALLKSIAKFSRGRVGAEELKSGVQEYSLQYFIGELRNELTAATEDEEGATAVLDAMAGLPKKYFKVRDIRSTTDDSYGLEPARVTACLKHLYEIGAIGLVQGSRSKLRHFVFTYKGDQVPFRSNGEFILHNALIRAYSIPWQ